MLMNCIIMKRNYELNQTILNKWQGKMFWKIKSKYKEKIFYKKIDITIN